MLNELNLLCIISSSFPSLLNKFIYCLKLKDISEMRYNKIAKKEKLIKIMKMKNC